MKQFKLFLIIFLFVFGTTLAFGFLSAGEWVQPTNNPPTNGLVRPVEDEGTAGVYYTARAMEINADFLSGTDNLYVDTTNGRVGIGTNSPVTTLEVSGDGIQLLDHSLPACTASNLGAIGFSSSETRLCTSSGWGYLHADLNGDGQY